MLSLISGRNRSAVVRVLIVEETAATAELLTRELERSGIRPVSERVDTERGFCQALRSFGPDVILSAPAVQEFHARAALKALQALRPTAPFILVVERFDEQTAVACLRAGAETVVLRSNLDRLGPAMQKALAIRQPLRRLSRRQLEVLRLVTEGHTSREIATGLGLSVKTVETHRGAGMRRLGIDDVAGLVRYAVRVGLIPQVHPPAEQAGPGIVAANNRFAAAGYGSALQLASE